jgi:hypothetical protein
MQTPAYWTIPIRYALILLVSFSVYLCSEEVLAVRPFVTDDAQIVYKKQLETETYGGMTMVKGETNWLSRRTHCKTMPSRTASN